MALENIRQNEPSTTLQSTQQNCWSFRGISPSTPANRTRQQSPVIKPKHDCLEELSVDTLLTRPTEYVWKYTEKENFLTRSYYLLRQPSLSAAMSHLPELKGPGNNKATTCETNLHPPGQRKIYEEVLSTTFDISHWRTPWRNLLYPQVLNIYSRHPTIFPLFSLSSLGKEIRKL